MGRPEVALVMMGPGFRRNVWYSMMSVNAILTSSMPKPPKSHRSCCHCCLLGHCYAQSPLFIQAYVPRMQEVYTHPCTKSTQKSTPEPALETAPHPARPFRW